MHYESFVTVFPSIQYIRDGISDYFSSGLFIIFLSQFILLFIFCVFAGLVEGTMRHAWK